MGRTAPEINLTTAEAVVLFIETYCKVPEGMLVGQPMKLRDWQVETLVSIYDYPTRRAIISYARKNGKTALIAMLVLAHLVGPVAIQNSQIYSAAQSREQAALVFKLAAKMIRMDARLNQLITIRDTFKELHCTLTGATYRALAAEATTSFGVSAVVVIHDELGQVKGPRSELFDALETSMGAYEAPLTLIISTQASQDNDLLSILIDDAATGADPKTKLFLWMAEEDADPWDRATWDAANPALDDFRSLADMEDLAGRAERLPAFEASFRNLYLNQRADGTSALFSPSLWKKCGSPIDLDVFRKGPCFAGLDLSGKNDLTCFALTAQAPDLVWHLKPYFFSPLEGIKERAARDRAPYDLWADQGHLEATPGRTVDYDVVADRIGEISSEFPLEVIYFDPWRIDDLRRALEAIGVNLPLEPCMQGYKGMAPAIDFFETVVVNESLAHGMHPVLLNHISNAQVVRDGKDNRMFMKNKSTGRIDGTVASAMALRAGEVGVEAWDGDLTFIGG